MASREHIALTDNQWVEIPLDPNADGHNTLIINQVTSQRQIVEWSYTNDVPTGTNTNNLEPNKDVEFEERIFLRWATSAPSYTAPQITNVSISVTRTTR